MTTYKVDDTTAAESGLSGTSEIDSIAIQRMIEEVRSGDSSGTPASYNRTHNKHNR